MADFFNRIGLMMPFANGLSEAQTGRYLPLRAI